MLAAVFSIVQSPSSTNLHSIKNTPSLRSTNISYFLSCAIWEESKESNNPVMLVVMRSEYLTPHITTTYIYSIPFCL